LSENDRRLRELLTRILLIDDDQYRDDYGPAQIGSWDSLAMVEIAGAVEAEFGRAMDPEEMVALQSIGDIKSFLRREGVDI
jgi:acyl carrier protein